MKELGMGILFFLIWNDELFQLCFQPNRSRPTILWTHSMIHEVVSISYRREILVNCHSVPLNICATADLWRNIKWENRHDSHLQTGWSFTTIFDILKWEKELIVWFWPPEFYSGNEIEGLGNYSYQGLSFFICIKYLQLTWFW